MGTVRFLGQPLSAGDQLGADLLSHLNSGYTQFRVLVAWAKSSGLARLDSAIRQFRQSGGQTEAIVGIDAQGGTWEGLEQAMDLFDHAYVFQDPGSRTFHPKVYLLDSTAKAAAWVGSNNLTSGGLFANYEATVSLHLDHNDKEDDAVCSSLHAYIDWFKGHQSACQLLDDKLLDALKTDPRDLIQSEREQNKRAGSHRVRVARSPSIFGAPLGGLRQAPPPPPSAVPGDESDEDSRIPPISNVTPTQPGRRPQAGGPSTQPAPPVPRGFYKRLVQNDVSLTSSPGQMIIPIEFIDFFPPLQVEIDNTATGGPRQMAREIPTRFQDGSYTQQAFARVIYYEPARTHPRQNIDLRFTFREQDILTRLSAGDYLVFEQDAYGLVVTRQPPGAYPNRWAWL